jgi:SAM-dependent methyltransferase
MAQKISLPIYVPTFVYRVIRTLKRSYARNGAGPIAINIGGERNIEWSFISSEIPSGTGEALEFGCEQGYMSLVAAQKGFHVIANDLEPQGFCWEHPQVKFVHGDFLKLDVPENHFDLVIDCSSIEHVGVAGRYGITVEDDEGDLQVMRKFERILKPGGKIVMTGPVGKDAVLSPWCRVYGERRLPRLFGGLQIEREEYWMKNKLNQWVKCDRETALRFAPRNHETNPHECAYNLGCFTLRKRI